MSTSQDIRAQFEEIQREREQRLEAYREKRRTISLKISEDLYQRLVVAAYQDRQSMSDLIRELLEQRLGVE